MIMVDIESLNIAKIALRVSLVADKEISRDILNGGLSVACEDNEFGDLFCDVIADELASNIKSYEAVQSGVQSGEKVEIGFVCVPMKVVNRVSKILKGSKISKVNFGDKTTKGNRD